MLLVYKQKFPEIFDFLNEDALRYEFAELRYKNPTQETIHQFVNKIREDYPETFQNYVLERLSVIAADECVKDVWGNPGIS